MKREVDPNLDSYLDQLFKIIPAEITGAYVAASAFLIGPNPESETLMLAGFAVFLTFLVPFYLRKLQGVHNRAQLIVSTISFPIWAASTSIVLIASYIGVWSKILGLVLIGWVLVTPLLIPSPPQTATPLKVQPGPAGGGT